jgi:ferredoxin
MLILLNNCEQIISKSIIIYGLKLSAGFKVCMRGNNIAYYEADTIENQKGKILLWEKRLGEIVSIVKSRSLYKIECESLLQHIGGTGIMYGLVRKSFPSSDKQFWTDDTCTGCGTCQKLCSVKNIVMQDNFFIFKSFHFCVYSNSYI